MKTWSVVAMVVISIMGSYWYSNFLYHNEPSGNNMVADRSVTNSTTISDDLVSDPASDIRDVDSAVNSEEDATNNQSNDGLGEEKVTPLDSTIASEIDLSTDRIIAFYGNFYSSNMGILGEYQKTTVETMLSEVVDNWNDVDPNRRHVPAIHYIASTAQSDPMPDGLYTLRMPADQILQAIAMSARIEGVTFLDLQIGQSDLLTEVKRLERYLLLPTVHLGIDPEFAMQSNDIPGQKIGTIDAEDINSVIDYLEETVVQNNLPPKILVIHRFTKNMITNVHKIKSSDLVNVVINMDGWGSPGLKFSTYQNVVTADRIQYSGFKIFYKNDLRPPSSRIVSSEEILGLDPQPVYIQYQ